MMALADNFLFSLFSLSALFGIIFLFLNLKNRLLLQKIAFYVSVVIFITALTAFCLFAAGNHPSIFAVSAKWMSSLNMVICLGADKFSMSMILLAAAFLPVSIITVSHAQRIGNAFYSCLFFLQAAVIGLFSSEDLFSFFFFWQLSILPVLFLSGIWGKQGRAAAVEKFFIVYSVFSLLFLLGIFGIAENMHYLTGNWSLVFKDVAKAGISSSQQIFYFILLMPVFMLRLAAFPLHTWFCSLAKENQPAVNIFLAGTFIPAGAAGLVKIIFPILPKGVLFLSPYLSFLFALSFAYLALMAWAAKSFSGMLAYLFSAQFSLVLFGLFSSYSNKMPALFLTVAISVSAAVLFFLSGAIENRAKTDIIADLHFPFKGMPRTSSLLLIALLSIAGLPCLASFPGIYGIIRNAFSSAPFSAIIAVAGVFFSFACCFRAAQEMLFGKKTSAAIAMPELKKQEILVVLPFVIILFFLGIMPNFSAGCFAGGSTDSVSREALNGKR